jgi:2Fe-2S ferredoxin
MPKVTYIEYNGKEHPVELPVGRSVMRGAVDNNIPGIDADCGGECACATCHVYVDAAWLAKTGLPVPGSSEASMLSFAALAQGNRGARWADRAHAGRATLASPKREAVR